MTVHYRCRYCEVEIGSLPIQQQDLKRLHLMEVGEIDDYIERNATGDTVVQTICERCEEAVKNWLQQKAALSNR